MTRLTLRRSVKSDAGGALVELAIVLPVLVLVFAGTIDFSRVFYTSIALSNAARSGAQYGSYNIAQSGNFATMQSRAISSIVPNTGVTATAERNCRCATDAGVFGSAVLCTSTCSSGQHLVVTVTVAASKRFTTIMGTVPGIPAFVDLTRAATMRVPN